MRAKLKKKYNRKKNNSINIFVPFDPFKKFEETKFENFKNSSKLEGININYPEENITIEEILAKHKKVS
jgi:ribosomal protein RSM22 (predicted rRNA methylase)